jgi:hypothetical protein
VRIVTPGYLNALGMHLESGRDFSWSDSARSQHVVIMNRAAARDLWPNQDPLGRIVYLNGETRLIGVVSDVREHSLEASAEAELYLPVTQADPEGAELVLRSALPPDTLQPSVMAALRSLNPAQPATELQPLQGIVDRAVSPRRFFVLFICSFGALALLLASLGIYGVISYSVTQQRRQIGIRMALGASARTVQGEVLKRCLGMALAGIVVGLVLSLAAGKTISSLLFGTTPLDLLPLASAALLIAAIALAAGFVPARRAAKIDPIATLRNS